MSIYVTSSHCAASYGVIWRKLLRHAAQIALGFCILTAMSQLCVIIPGNPIPMTFGPQGPIAIGFILTPMHAFMASLTYVISGMLGAPIFAGFKGGVALQLGYLLAYPLAAACVARCSSSKWMQESKLWSKNTFFYFARRYLVAVGATLIIYSFGVLGIMGLQQILTSVIGYTHPASYGLELLGHAIELGVTPFLWMCLFIKLPLTLAVLESLKRS